MSHTPFSASGPRRGGTFRPQLEALEDRFAPGSLLSMSPGSSIELGAAVARKREAADLAVLAGLLAHHRTIVTSSEVQTIADGAVVGSSTLIRTGNGVTAFLYATGLPPGAYTLWTKVDAPDGSTVSGRLAGRVVGRHGILLFAAHVRAGEILGAGNDVNPDFPSGPLKDPLHSTITLVVRYHGPADPGRIYEQTHTYEPGVAVNYLRSIHLPPA